MNNQCTLLLILVSLIVIPITPITNLINNNDFQQVAGTPGWYSIYSGTVRRRYITPRSTHVIDTLNSNTHEKICYDVTHQSSLPYQLSFDYFNDESTTRGVFKVSWNALILEYRAILDLDTHGATYTVYLSQPTNVLCFEGWGQAETTLIGILIDNIILIPFDIRYVHFDAMQSNDEVNFIELVSNLTVSEGAELELLKSGTVVNMSGAQYEIDEVGANGDGLFQVRLEILQQYGSIATNISISIPTHRNSQGQLTQYIITSSTLPRLLYQPQQIATIVGESKPYLLMLTKIYNICFKVIKIIAFSFVGLRYMSFYCLALLLGFLDVHYVLDCVRVVVGEIMGYTIHSGNIGYLMGLLGFGTYGFGAQYLPATNTTLSSEGLRWALPYTVSSINNNIYMLLIDDLIIAVFNTVKILLLYHLIFKSNTKMRRILLPIKNEKILLQYIIIFSVVVFVCGVCWRSAWQVYNVYEKINYGVSMAVPCVGLFLCAGIFVGEWGRMNKSYYRLRAKGKSRSEENQKIRLGYCNKILLDFTESVTFIIIPLLIGLNYIYATLAIFFILTILKIKLAFTTLTSNRNFLSFVYIISLFLQLLIVLSYFLPHIIETIPILSQNVQKTWMTIFSYNSISLLFLYAVAGFIQISCTAYRFIRGFSVLELVCDGNKVANQCQEEGGNEIKIQKQVEDLENANNKEKVEQLQIESDIKTINILKDKVSEKAMSKNSLQEISNPFIKSPKKEQQKQKQPENISQKLNKLTEQKGKAKKEARQARLAKVITMKVIEVAQTYIHDDQIKERAKSASHSNCNKQLIVKKPKQLSKQKGLHLIKKLQLRKPSQVQQVGLSLLGKVGASNFEKQQNFS